MVAMNALYVLPPRLSAQQNAYCGHSYEVGNEVQIRAGLVEGYRVVNSPLLFPGSPTEQITFDVGEYVQICEVEKSTPNYPSSATNAKYRVCSQRRVHAGWKKDMGVKITNYVPSSIIEPVSPAMGQVPSAGYYDPGDVVKLSHSWAPTSSVRGNSYLKPGTFLIIRSGPLTALGKPYNYGLHEGPDGPFYVVCKVDPNMITHTFYSKDWVSPSQLKA
ncbi:hypothetical protein D9758_014979 [Tetrapyrgos nigripes]|uniref:Uncharacterized protein n=1 Tax=Tetrapyrgos nigripes TaxID=182062 RepID=A0A8H5CGK9_9AGAR|nr:hypothetical protein D9758_014979 [Tetrapyrgos nigripes]